MKRRDFLRSSIVLSTFMATRPVLALYSSVEKAVLGLGDLIKDQNRFIYSPFQKPPQPTVFDGDNDDFPHQILWDKVGYLKSIGEIQKMGFVKNLIVGAGVSGSVAAYDLSDDDVLVLEQADCVGGNSKGHAWAEGLSSIGSAYIVTPDKNSEIEKFLIELDVLKDCRKEFGRPVFSQNKYFKDFEELLNDDERQVFHRILERFKYILENSYPQIPYYIENQEVVDLLKLDIISFYQWLSIEFRNIPDIILKYFESYSWSSFNGSIKEISAAQYLNFICGELNGLVVFPGGNAFLISKIWEKISDKVNLLCGSVVVDIKKDGQNYKVLFVKDHIAYEIMTRNVIFSAPKFMISKVFDGAEFKSVVKSSQNLEYRPYVVAQVRLNQNIDLKGYDQFILSDDLMKDIGPLNPPQNGFTDLVDADWVYGNRNQYKTKRLTIYKPFPYQGAQQFLFHPNSFNKIEDQIRSQLNKVGIKSSTVDEISLTRWGHSMPVASVGKLKSRSLEFLQKTKLDGLYFVGQDVFANPSFEAAFLTARFVTDDLKKKN